MTGESRKQRQNRKIHEDYLKGLGWRKSSGNLWRDPLLPQYTYNTRNARKVQRGRLEMVREVMTK